MQTRIPLVNDEFVMGYRLQTEWAWLISAAFFFGKIGGGLFMVSLVLNQPVLALTGILIVGIGKSAAHLIYLGQPLRCWRILTRPGSSWIARGFWGMMAFIAFGLLYLLVPQGTILWQVLRVLAGLAAFVVMIYDGFVMNASPSIPLWNTALMPVLCLFYSILGGITLTLFFAGILGTTVVVSLETLEQMELAILITNFILVVFYLMSMFNSTAAAREGADLLVRGRFAKAFYTSVLAVGMLLTFMLALYVSSTGNLNILFMATLADLIGHFFIFFLLLRAGVFSPVLGKFSL